MTTRVGVVALVGLVSLAAGADERRCVEVHRSGGTRDEVARCVPFAYPRYARLQAGLGAVPLVAGSSASFSLDYSPHSFSGSSVKGGALATGTSLSFDVALDGRWVGGTLGLFAQLDLTYMVLSAGWSQEPSTTFPFRVQLGWRLGLGITRSFPLEEALPWAQPYTLIRPELRTFLNLEFPLDWWRVHSFVISGAVDTPASLTAVFRFSICAGFNWGFTYD